MGTVIVRIFDLIFLLLLIYVFLTWIPSINWYKEPFKALRSFSDIFFSPFRKLIPPIGGVIDISPIIAFVALSALRWAILTLLSVFNLI